MKTISLKMAVAVFASVIGMTSCDDYLEVTPQNTLTTGNFYKTEGQMDQALTGLYGLLKPVPKYLFAMSEIRSDNVWVLTDSRQNDYVDVATFNDNGLLTAALVEGCWSDYFKIVSAANTLLDNMEKADMSAAVRKQYTAEARFMRALAYFDLVRFFERVPAPTHILTTEESFRLGQSEAVDVYENIIVPDLRFAVDNLADEAKDYQNVAHSERVTSLAAKAMLGKVYLTMSGFPLNITEKKDSATVLFADVVDIALGEGNYWMNDISTWNNAWISENDNKHAIFEIQYIAASGQGNPMVTLSVPTNPGTEWCGNNLVTGTHLYVEKGLQMHFIEKDTLTDEYLDKRADGTINLVETVDEEGNIITSTGNTFYVKYFENKKKRAKLGYSDIDASVVDRTYWPQNYLLIRVEDIMLLYAECLGNTEEGRGLVNMIRKRAGLQPIADDLTEVEYQEAVANERRYELAEEGHRWFDLVRQNKYVETMKQMFISDDETVTGTYRQYADRVGSHSYIYPIPLSQIQVREGLYQQNKGY